MIKKQKNSYITKCNKISLSIDISENAPIEKDYSLPKLLSEFSEIKKILSFKNIKTMQFLYFNRKKIEVILYDEEEIIFIDSNCIEMNLSNYFYLSLLIADNTTISNYVYKIDLINEINKLNKKDNSKNLKNIMISKIIIDLINNYTETEYFEESLNNELKKIREENLKIIESIINEFNQNLNFEIEVIKSEKIDKVYLYIIKSLIKRKKFEEYEYTDKILSQLDLENIHLTKIMLDDLSNLFDSNEEFILKYKITEVKELFNNSIINFYFLLFKYIIKDSIYIYHINYLTKLKTKIIKFVKNDEKILALIDKEKLYYIIKIFLDSEYYYKLFIKKFDFNKERNKSDDIIENKLKNFIEKILSKSSFILKRDENGEINLSILEEKGKENRIKKLKYNNDFNILEKNLQKFLEFLSFVKEKIKKEFKYKYNLIIKLTFDFIEENNSLFNISCKYKFYPINRRETLSFNDNNVLDSCIWENLEGLYYLLYEINDEKYKNILFQKDLNIFKIIKEKDDLEKKLEENKEMETEENKIPLSELCKLSEASEYEIIKFIKKIGKHKYYAEFIKQLSNGYFISGGACKYLYIYDQNFKKINDINIHTYPINVYEKEYNKNSNNLKLISYSKEQINIITLDLNQECNYDVNDILGKSASVLLEIRDNYFINNTIGGYFVDYLFKDFQKVLNSSYKVGLKINDKIIALTSNEIIPKGKNEIILYNAFSDKIERELEGYSCSLRQNSLLLIQSSINNDNILICACKDYKNNQNNGILLLQIKSDYEIKDLFYNTNKFEPFCICDIHIISKSSNSKTNDVKQYKTNYFFVGGLDNEKGEGKIKLFKIIYKYKNNNNIKVQFIQDIILINNKNENFYGFKGAITCIIQSNETGNFLITSNDGNVYEFSPPNLSYYLYYDEEIKNGNDYYDINYFDQNNNITQKNDNKKMFNELLEIYKNKISFNLDFLKQ